MHCCTVAAPGRPRICSCDKRRQAGKRNHDPLRGCPNASSPGVTACQCSLGDAEVSASFAGLRKPARRASQAPAFFASWAPSCGTQLHSYIDGNRACLTRPIGKSGHRPPPELRLRVCITLDQRYFDEDRHVGYMYSKSYSTWIRVDRIRASSTRLRTPQLAEFSDQDLLCALPLLSFEPATQATRVLASL